MTMICETCQTSFAIKPSDVKRGRGRYCSHACYGKACRSSVPEHERQTKKRLSARQWRQAHTAERSTYNKAWRAAHPGYDQAWRDANRTSVRDSAQASEIRHRDDRLVRRRERHKENPEIRTAEYARRQARKRAVARNDLTAAQWKEIKAAYGYCCVYCGKQQQRLTQDHIIPLSKGGDNTLSNVVPACQSCNSRKGTGAPLMPVQPLLLTVA